MIKKIVILIIGLVFLVSTANAEPLVMRTGCDILAPDGSTTFFAVGKEVIKNGNKATIICKGTLPAEIAKPDSALYFDYANTGISLHTDQYEVNNGWAEDWNEVITPSGQYILKITVDLKRAI